MKKKQGILSTIVFSVKYMIKNCNAKDLLVSNLWVVLSALSGVMLMIQKEWFNNTKAAVFHKPGALKIAITFLIVMLAVQVIQSVCDTFSENASNRLWIVLKNKLNSDLLTKSFRIKARYFDNPETFNIFSRSKDQYRRVLEAAECTFSLFGSLFSLISCILAIATDSWPIMLLAVLGCVPILITQYFISKINYRNALWEAPCRRRAGYMYIFMISSGYFKEMRMLGFFDYMFKKYKDASKELIDHSDGVAVKFAVLNAVSSVIRYIILGFALWMAVLSMMSGHSDIGSFALVYGAILSIQGSSINLFKLIARIRENNLFVADYVNIMNMEEENLSGLDAPAPENVEIRFDHVTFAYPGSDREVLKDFSVSFKTGEKVAIVGENGAGKSTFVALLLGLYEPQQGKITYNGVPISECLGLVRKTISTALQKHGLYEMTMAENVRLGDAFRKDVPFEDIVTVSKNTGFDSAVHKMKEDYETLFGYHKDDSYDLSGGESQKLINSRALLRQDARFLVLDEPTAALDPVAEAEVYKNFNQLTGDKSCILISHRLGVATVVDRVLVIKDGKIEEDGSHEELLSKNGAYAEMWNAQAKWYQNCG